MTPIQRIACGHFVALLGAGVIFTTGACHRHRHHHDAHHHHHRSVLLVMDEDVVALEASAASIELAPGEDLALDVAEGRHDVDVFREDGTHAAFLDVPVEGDETVLPDAF